MQFPILSLVAKLSFVLASNLIASQAIASSLQPEPYRALSPNSFDSISINQMVANYQTPHSVFSPRPQEQVNRELDQAKAQEQVKQQLLMAQTQALMNKINPNALHSAQILAEWKVLKAQLETMVQKQLEVDELHHYMKSLSRIVQTMP